MEIIAIIYTWTHITVLLTLGLSLVDGQDEFMTCSRPVKTSRSSRQQIHTPCDTMAHTMDSWCTLPGPYYPWHSVRRFVFENQGLMRRMYGEVRQLSLLRMEFSGDSNTLEESRDFDDLFRPITTFDPASTSHFTTESIPTLVVMSSSVEETEIRISSTSTVSSSKGTSTEIVTGRVNNSVGNNSTSGDQSEESDSLTTIPDMVTTTEEIMDKEAVENTGGMGIVSSLATDEPLLGDTDSTLSTSLPEGELVPVPSTMALDQNVPKSHHDSSGASEMTSDESVQVEVQVKRNSSQEDQEGEKTRNEGQMLLFQDFEKFNSKPPSTTTTEEPRIRTTNQKQGVNACPVKEEVVAPYWANNTRGEVLALLNLYPFEQYIHWEKCTNEHRQMYCRDGCRCEQQYRLHRLLAFDPQNECRGIFSDWFRFPSCCVCKCYFDDLMPERVTFNRSPRVFGEPSVTLGGWNELVDLDGPDVNGVDDSHFFYKYSSTFRQPRK